MAPEPTGAIALDGLRKTGYTAGHMASEINTVVPTTRWHVITGAPCSGKTTVIDRLAGDGYATVAEAARAEIDARLNRGQDLASAKADLAAFEASVLRRKRMAEAALPPDRLVFLDRGIPDTIAYCRLYGLDAEPAIAASLSNHYARVFCLEPLAYQSDRVRTEDRQEASRLDALLRDAYRRLGYPIISVPVLSVDQRVAYILDHLAPENRL